MIWVQIEESKQAMHKNTPPLHQGAILPDAVAGSPNVTLFELIRIIKFFSRRDSRGAKATASVLKATCLQPQTAGSDDQSSSSSSSS